MAITSNTAKVKFFIGDFDYNTTLEVPSASQSNKLTLDFQELISPSLPSWGTTPIAIYSLLSVTFEGKNIYENQEYNNAFGGSTEPVSADILTTPNTNPATSEDSVVNYYVPMIMDKNGLPSNGKYDVSVKFVYWDGANFIITEAYNFSANLNYERIKPSISVWYDQEVPILSMTDTQDYMINGVSASVQTEFNLSPPQNRASIIKTFTDIQNVSYNKFVSGSNELTYTSLITYNSDYIVVQLEQDYKSFLIYYMDWCSTYTCLGDLYKSSISTTCNPSQKQYFKEKLLSATSLIQQIKLGLGCGKDTLSGLIEELNELLGCDCGCADDKPKVISADTISSISDIQFVTALTDTTLIDLSQGSTVFLSLDVDGGTTDVSVVNFSEYGYYKFVVTNASQDIVQVANFDPLVFNSPVGDVVINASDEIIINDFFATTASELTLENSNISTAITSISSGAGLSINTANPFVPVVLFTPTTIAQLALAQNSLQQGQGYVNYIQQDVEVTTGATVVDLSLGNVVRLNVLNTNTAISATNIVDRKRYVFQIYSSTGKTATFDDGVFRDANGPIDAVIPSGVSNTMTVLEFMGANLGSPSLLLMSRTDEPLGTETIAATPLSLTTLDNVLNDTFIINATTDTEIDLSNDSPKAGSRITIIISSATGNTVEFDSGQFFGDEGAFGLFTPTSVANSRNVLQFIGADVGLAQPKYVLVSSNIIQDPPNATSYQDLGVQSGAVAVDFGLGENVAVQFSNNAVTLNPSNFSVGKVYSIQVSNTGSTTQNITFGADFDLGSYGQVVPVAVDESVSFTLLCVDDGGAVLKRTGQSKPPVTKLQTELETISTAYFADFSKSTQYFQIEPDTSTLLVSAINSSFIGDGKIYVFSIKASSGACNINFASGFYSPVDQTAIPTISLALNEIATLTFIGASSITGGKLILSSIEKPEPDSYQDLGLVSDPVEINLSSGNDISLSFANEDISVSATNLVEGEIYNLTIFNNGVGRNSVTFDVDNFIVFDPVFINSTGTFGISFMCVDLFGDLFLTPIAPYFQNPPSYQDLGTVSTNQTVNFANGKNVFMTTADTDYNIAFDGVVVGETYTVGVRNGGAGARSITVSETYIPTISIASGEVYAMTLLAVLIGGVPSLVVSGSATV